MTSDPKPTKRIKATRKDWQTMRWHKLTQGCRLCGVRDRVEFHHLVGRDLGGDDVLDNLVPLCPQHHQAVEERKPEASILRDHLRASELRYMFDKKGIVFLNRYYPPWDEDLFGEEEDGDTLFDPMSGKWIKPTEGEGK